MHCETNILKRNADNNKNHREISVFPQIFKLFDKIIRKRISQFIFINSIPYDNIYNFILRSSIILVHINNYYFLRIDT